MVLAAVRITATAFIVDADKYVFMLFQTSVTRSATVAFVITFSRIGVEQMPLGTFNIYSVLEFPCLTAVQWMYLGLAYLRQVGAYKLLRTFRAAFNPHFFVSLPRLLCQLLDSLFFLLFCHIFLDRDKICLQIENLSRLSMDCLPQRLDLMSLGSYCLLVAC